MDTKLIHHFLNDITKHNNREWFQANKSRYLEAKENFELGVAQAITRLYEVCGFDHALLARQVTL